MKVTPVAFDSMGVRSVATFVETDDVKILIDPAASLGPLRFSLPPHPEEWRRLEKAWADIVEYAKLADVLVISHYHFDHHAPGHELKSVYMGKTLLSKHPTQNINKSQISRAAVFYDNISGFPKIIEWADGREFKFGKTRIRFSPPVFHGVNSMLGFVIETLVDDGKYRFIHTSDIEGPAVKEQADFILQNKPNLVFVDGPLSYIMLRYGTENMKRAIENLTKILKTCPLDALVIDHHLLRDKFWQKRIEPVFKASGEVGIKVQTAAEYAGRQTEQLEAMRKELWKKSPSEKYKIPDSLRVHVFSADVG